MEIVQDQQKKNKQQKEKNNKTVGDLLLHPQLLDVILSCVQLSKTGMMLRAVNMTICHRVHTFLVDTTVENLLLVRKPESDRNADDSMIVFDNQSGTFQPYNSLSSEAKKEYEAKLEREAFLCLSVMVTCVRAEENQITKRALQLADEYDGVSPERKPAPVAKQGEKGADSAYLYKMWLQDEESAETLKRELSDLKEEYDLSPPAESGQNNEDDFYGGGGGGGGPVEITMAQWKDMVRHSLEAEQWGVFSMYQDRIKQGLLPEQLLMLEKINATSVWGAYLTMKRVVQQQWAWDQIKKERDEFLPKKKLNKKALLA